MTLGIPPVQFGKYSWGENETKTLERANSWVSNGAGPVGILKNDTPASQAIFSEPVEKDHWIVCNGKELEKAKNARVPGLKILALA